MINGVKYWVGQIPFFLLLVPFLWYQLYLATVEWKRRLDHHSRRIETRYSPIPVKLLVFICLNCSCALRIIFTFYVWHLDIDDPGANLNAYTIYIFNVYFIILEWWFIVFFWISMLFGFVASKTVFDPTVLKKIETILWVIVSIVTVFHAILIFFNSYGHDIIDTDNWWRLGYLIIVYIGILAFAIYSTRLLRAYRSIKYDKIIYKKLLWFVLILDVCGIPTATLSPFYFYFGKGHHPTQDIMNLVFSFFEWGHYPMVIILLGSGPVVNRLATLLRMPRLQKSKSSTDSNGTGETAYTNPGGSKTNTKASAFLTNNNNKTNNSSSTCQSISISMDNEVKDQDTTSSKNPNNIIDDGADEKKEEEFKKVEEGVIEMKVIVEEDPNNIIDDGADENDNLDQNDQLTPL